MSTDDPGLSNVPREAVCSPPLRGASHTPGPWTATQQNGGWQIDAAMDAVATTHFCYATEAEANARLIAAAPDLLAALKSAVSVADEAAREWDAAPEGMKAGKLLLALCGHLKRYRADIDAIHAAIARAEGRS